MIVEGADSVTYEPAVVNAPIPSGLRRNPGIGWMALAAAFFYFACFCALTWPLITRFQTHFFFDDGDGMQFVWNAWWVNKALAEGMSPWQTPYLHYPYGISLAGHTLSPFNAFLGALLYPSIGMTAAMNVLVVSTFVLGGVTAFALCLYASRSFVGSLAGGFVFAFSSYHFAHAQGHLNLTSIQWIPLYLLLWIKFVRGPTAAIGVWAALALFLVALCDLYYLLFCALASAVVGFWYERRYRPKWSAVWRRYRVPAAAFGISFLATSGVLAAWVLLSALRDPFAGPGHNPAEHSADLLAPFFPGEHSRWGHLTRGLWKRHTMVGAETSIYLGVTVLILIAVAVKVGAMKARRAELWFWLFGIFAVLSLGPILTVGGVGYPLPILPCLTLLYLYWHRAALGLPGAGPCLAVLAAYILLVAQPVYAIDRTLGLIVAIPMLGLYVWLAATSSNQDRLAKGVLAVFSLSVLVADYTFSSRLAVAAIALMAALLIARSRKTGEFGLRAAWTWAAAIGYFLLIALANETPKTTLSLGALP